MKVRSIQEMGHQEIFSIEFERDCKIGIHESWNLQFRMEYWYGRGNKNLKFLGISREFMS